MGEVEGGLIVHEEVVDRNRLKNYRRAAQGTGVTVRKVGGVGTKYETSNGIQLSVPDGQFLIRISGTRTQRSLFWRIREHQTGIPRRM